MVTPTKLLRFAIESTAEVGLDTMSSAALSARQSLTHPLHLRSPTLVSVRHASQPSGPRTPQREVLLVNFHSCYLLGIQHTNPLPRPFTGRIDLSLDLPQEYAFCLFGFKPVLNRFVPDIQTITTEGTK